MVQKRFNMKNKYGIDVEIAVPWQLTPISTQEIVATEH